MHSDHLPATLLRRLAAAVYDGLLIIGLWMAATFPLLAFYQGDAVPSQSWWYPLYLLGICGGFHIWFWTHGGQTLGMRAWRLWAVNEHGEPLGYRQAIWRYLLAVASWLTLLGMLWCIFEPRGRALQDIISRSDIIHIPKTN